jgi:hypothetical protein
MQCNQCKQEVDVESWKFCPNCGRGLEDEKIINFLRKIFLSKRNLAVFIAIILVLLGTLAFFIIKSNRTVNEKNKEIARMLEQKDEVKVEAEIPEKIMPITYVGENKKLATLKISSPGFGQVKTEIEVKGITNHETQIINLKPESKIYYLSPDITEEGYRNLAESKKAEVSLKVSLLEDDGGEKILIEDNKEIFFYSRNDIIWAEDNGSDNANFAVRWVNKDKDEVKELVRKAAEHMKELGGNDSAMVGAQGDKEESKRQMKAIFLAMAKDYQIRYIMAPFSYDSNDAQKVKPPEEVIRTKSGLCIELSLLMAAALENIGLNPVVVITEDHAWAGLETSPRSNDFIFIETTALENTPAEAMAMAQKNWKEIKDKGFYKILKLNELRSEGYLPIKY